jgi:hypothetical protein
LPALLQLLSEKCPPTGGFAGSSVEKLLTQTSLRPPGLLVREAIQNTVDAALPGKKSIQFNIHLRRLQPAQTQFLRDALVPPSGTAGFGEVYSQVNWDVNGGPHVLELADYETRGLGGGVDPRDEPGKGERTDFVDFVFKIGKTKDMRDQVGGGTFGFGKASSYMMSSAHTVIVHSATEFDGRVEERLIVITLGKQFSQSGKMYTGRHWFGRVVDSSEGVVHPLIGEAAARVASELGLPPRAGRTGTTLCILAPRIDSVGHDESMAPIEARESMESRFLAALEEAVHYWCWPLFYGHQMARHPVVKFGLFVHGKDESVRLRPRDLFFGSLAAQYHRLLSHDKEATRSLMARVSVPDARALALRLDLPANYPRQTVDVPLGRVCVEKFTGVPPRFNTGWSSPLVEEPVGHVALMRPIGTVVCYRAVKMRGGAAPRTPFLGVCLASEQAHGVIADSEPPTHDDWNPENVEQAIGQRLVRKVIKEVDEAAKQLFDTVPSAGGGLTTPATVGVSNFLGGLVGIGGRRNSTPPTGALPAGGTPPKGSTPTVLGQATLEIVDGRRTAVFRVRRPAEDNGSKWNARPQVVIDGKSVVDASEGFIDPPEVTSWMSPSGEVVCDGQTISGVQRSQVNGKELRVRVSLPRPYVVALKIEVEHEADSSGRRSDTSEVTI